MDRTVLTAQLLLGAYGVVGVAAAAPGTVGEHIVRTLLALLVTVLASRLRSSTIVKLSPYAFVTVLLALAAVLAFGISPAGSDSKRWLPLFGFALQPSEFMKVAVIAYLTAFFHNHLGNWQIWRPMAVIGVAVAIIIAEPDLSTGLFIFALAFAVMVAAGITLTRLVSISVAAALIGVLLGGSYISQFSYMSDRIMGFQDLWGAQELVADTNYQAVQARAAAQRGGATGIGTGRPVTVPEAETDFVSVAIAQSLGLVGVAGLVLTYLVLGLRSLAIARMVTGPAALLAAGAAAYICGQAGLNLLVASGFAPVTGIPLPGVSYGFNSQLSIAIAFAFVHIAFRQARSEKVEVAR
jgi:cell division protein FtsW